MEIDFEKMGGLVPAVIQDSKTNSVLMVGFMNREALEKTKAEGRVTFYSRSKKRLWTKGETSGNFLKVIEIKLDCDNDTILIRAEPTGPVCHKGSTTCFGENKGGDFSFLQTLSNIIDQRKISPKEGSYTSQLFAEGLNRIAQKVGEEAIELVIAAKDDDKARIREEAADLLFHYLVLLRERGIPIEEVITLLRERHK